MTYRIPIRGHKPAAKSKADVSYLGTCGGEAMPQPSDEATDIIEVEAKSHAEAYRKLCATYRPGDNRKIQGKALMKYFAVR